MAIRIKHIIYVLCCLLCSITVNAQQTTDVTKSISAIKRDRQYLYAETTMKDLDEAYNGAKAILESIVSDWIHEQYPKEDIELCIVKAKNHCLQLQTRRGDYYRAFVYVRKSDILPVSDKSEVNVFQVSPSTQENKPSVIQEESFSTPTLTLTDEEQHMKDIRSFYDIEPYIKEMVKADKIDNYGKYSTMPADSDCHLFIYNKEGEILAVLRKEAGVILNIKTMQRDDIKKYKDCGAIWFQLKSNRE